MRYRWNDKEVSEEEYQRLDEEWKKGVEAAELLEKNLDSRNPPPKKSLESKKSVRKKVTDSTV